MLSVAGLTRRFGEQLALDDVSFDVVPGRMTGFVGANGAGKTTAMRIILGVLAANAGEVRWNDGPLTQAVRRDFGYMPEERGLYPKMKIRDQLVFFGRLHGLDPIRAGERTDKLLERLGLGERRRPTYWRRCPSATSSGCRSPRRWCTSRSRWSWTSRSAVSTRSRSTRWSTCSARRSTTEVPVLFSSHQLDLVERLCDDLVVLSRGKVVAAGPVAELAAGPSLTYKLIVDGDAGWLRDVPGIRVRDVAGGTALFDVEDDGVAQQVLQQAITRGPVLEFGPERVALSDVFREATR